MDTAHGSLSEMTSGTAVQQLPGLLHSLEPTFNRFGYLAVGGLVLAEDFGVPVPGGTVLLLGAVYAGAGRLNILLVVLVGFCAAVIGDNIGFAIGHVGGRKFLDRFGHYVFLTPERADRLSRFFERRGGSVVMGARFVEGLRQANGLIAGTTRMRWKRFLVFNAIGAALWVALWSGLGYVSGDHIDTVYRDTARSNLYILAFVGVLLLGYGGHRLARRRRGKRRSGGRKAGQH